MNDNRIELIPCPFCSAEPEVLSDGHRTWGLVQHNDGCLFHVYPKHEIPESDFAAWNNRTPIEYDGWFYLPKPKEGIMQYGAPYAEEVENGYKIKQPVEVIESAIRLWGDELGEYVMKRICETWNTRAERTCENVWDVEQTGRLRFKCSDCGAVSLEITPNYCPNCGCKVVGE